MLKDNDNNGQTEREIREGREGVFIETSLFSTEETPPSPTLLSYIKVRAGGVGNWSLSASIKPSIASETNKKGLPLVSSFPRISEPPHPPEPPLLPNLLLHLPPPNPILGLRRNRGVNLRAVRRRIAGERRRALPLPNLTNRKRHDRTDGEGRREEGRTCSKGCHCGLGMRGTGGGETGVPKICWCKG